MDYGWLKKIISWMSWDYMFRIRMNCHSSSILFIGVTSAGKTLTRMNVWRWHFAAETCHKNPRLKIKEENSTRYIKKIIIFYNRARWLRGNARDSHSGGPGFESRCRSTWLGFFRGFPQSSRQMLGWIFITTFHLTIIHQIHISN